MKLNPIQACVSAASLFAHPSLSICSVAIMIGIMASSAHAELASQAVPNQYKAGAYCSSDTKAVAPVIAKGTQNKAFVADVFCIRQQLQSYQAEHQPINTRFQAYKADAWLSYVAHERNEASLTKASRYALAEALSIVEALKTNQVDKLPLTADIPPTSGLQRPDLWASLLTIKQTPAFAPLVKTVADSEVKLIWAAFSRNFLILFNGRNAVFASYVPRDARFVPLYIPITKIAIPITCFNIQDMLGYVATEPVFFPMGPLHMIVQIGHIQEVGFTVTTPVDATFVPG